ncbi:phosphomannomutase [Methylorubrum extorquens]|uniref:Phosphoglucomutase/phosphomannomutase alpha/beta/alpha domain I n=1 Tax=Methylorubrum extorquens DSM 13060 TaxID=882800 RepID=H1KJL6_METEX|nr:phosphomannomutase [Methylorubrum extorquens]EHP92261.1 phosphoglucomutase/phosphomannomutase alpha/beta/alpha domain I [Methylorubrum extorquens DSM 13060]
MSSLKFGTSGLRGLVTDLEGGPSYAYASAFFRTIRADGGEGTVVIGRDLRASSLGISATVAEAAAAAGLTVIDAGPLPTPALALEAMRQGACAVMVTGSHIPDDRNGLKFYRAAGEITKTDEAAIIAALVLEEQPELSGQTASTMLEPEALARYRDRYRAFFPADILSGLHLAVYQQSSVARDLLSELLVALGARVSTIGRSETFVPIDTEAHRPEDTAFIHETMASGTFDALVTTDGDADRPLMADEAGRILRGDVLGLLTARYLGIDTVVVPVTAGSALERAGFRQVMRTKVGSPFVIAGMEQARRDGADSVAGFEANGGFLLGSDVSLAGQVLPALPTRDAMLPILATLAAARAHDVRLSALVSTIDAGETASDRIPDIPAERSGAFLARLSEAAYLSTFLRTVGAPQAVDQQDGVRIELDQGRTIHFRASGNAPELRCYTEARSAVDAEDLLRWGLAAAAAEVQDTGLRP